MFCLVGCSVDNVTVFNLIKKQIEWEMAHISKETFAVFQVQFLMLQTYLVFTKSSKAGRLFLFYR